MKAVTVAGRLVKKGGNIYLEDKTFAEILVWFHFSFFMYV